MNSSILRGLYDAARCLSILPGSPTEPQRDEVQTWTLAFFPLVGAVFGLVALLLVEVLHERLPSLLAWGLPLTWLLLSRAQHFLSLSKLCNAFLAEGGIEERRSQLSLQATAVPGMALACVLFSGKIFAILEAQILHVNLLALTVFLTPIISRYVALMLALGTDSTHERTLAVAHRGKVIGLATLIVVASGFIAGGLFVLLLVCGLLTTVLVRVASERYLGMLPLAALGASVEICELLLLWSPIIAARFGFDVLLYNFVI